MPVPSSSGVQALSDKKHPQSPRERAQVMLQLYKHIRDEAAALVELSAYQRKSQLLKELHTHGHMLQKTLDTIERYSL